MTHKSWRKRLLALVVISMITIQAVSVYGSEIEKITTEEAELVLQDSEASSEPEIILSEVMEEEIKDKSIIEKMPEGTISIIMDDEVIGMVSPDGISTIEDLVFYNYLLSDFEARLGGGEYYYYTSPVTSSTEVFPISDLVPVYSKSNSELSDAAEATDRCLDLHESINTIYIVEHRECIDSDNDDCCDICRKDVLGETTISVIMDGKKIGMIESEYHFEVFTDKGNVTLFGYSVDEILKQLGDGEYYFYSKECKDGNCYPEAQLHADINSCVNEQTGEPENKSFLNIPKSVTKVYIYDHSECFDKNEDGYCDLCHVEIS